VPGKLLDHQAEQHGVKKKKKLVVAVLVLLDPAQKGRGGTSKLNATSSCGVPGTCRKSFRKMSRKALFAPIVVGQPRLLVAGQVGQRDQACRSATGGDVAGPIEWIEPTANPSRTNFAASSRDV
jgi:hypothetical protein